MEYKVGQKVVIRNGHSYGDPYRFGSITKVLKSQIEIDGKEKYMIASGRKVGDTSQYYSDRLVDNTSITEAEERNAEVKREQEHKNKARALDNVSYSGWISLDDTQLDTILTILHQSQAA